MLVGLPASGKSSWAAHYMSQNPELDFQILSTDNIIEEQGLRDGLSYIESHEKNIGFAIGEMQKRFRQYLTNGANIIHDQTNLTLKVRKQYLADLKDYFKSAIVFMLDDKIRVRRLRNREIKTGKVIPEFVLENMVEEFQFPTEEEGFDEVVRIEL